MGYGVGLAAFILSLILCFLNFILLPIVVWRAIMTSAALGTTNNNAVAAAASIGIVLLVLDVIGLILGIVGITTADDKKTFGILGTVFSAICLLFVIGAMSLGASAFWS